MKFFILIVLFMVIITIVCSWSTQAFDHIPLVDIQDGGNGDNGLKTHLCRQWCKQIEHSPGANTHGCDCDKYVVDG